MATRERLVLGNKYNIEDMGVIWYRGRRTEVNQYIAMVKELVKSYKSVLIVTYTGHDPSRLMNAIFTGLIGCKLDHIEIRKIHCSVDPGLISSALYYVKSVRFHGYSKTLIEAVCTSNVTRLRMDLCGYMPPDYYDIVKFAVSNSNLTQIKCRGDMFNGGISQLW